MKKSEIERLPDDKLIAHYLKYKEKLKKNSRYYSMQCGWAKDEMKNVD